MTSLFPSRSDLLAGRTALVTGASRGIGAAIATSLAEAGADIMLHSYRDQSAAVAAAEGIRAAGRRCAVVDADFTDSRAADTLADACEAFAPIDIAILNASVEMRSAWTDIDHTAFDRQIGANVWSTFRVAQRLLPAMAGRGWGRAVIIGSVQAVRPNPQLAVYAATKAALKNLADNLARIHAGDGVTVNTVAPGAIETDRNAAALSDPCYRAQVLARIPAGRLGRPDDCAAAVVFLCSEAASYITGAELVIDGGYCLV